MKLSLLALGTGSLICLLGTANAQEPVRLAVMPFSGTNIHPGYLDAAREILKDHLFAAGRFTVVSVAGPSGNVENTAADAVAQGTLVKASVALVVHLTRLQETVRIRLVAYRIPGGSVAHADTMVVAGGPDDMDPVLKRLAVGFATGKPASQTAEIDSVTQKEGNPYLKQTATRVVGVRLGMMVPTNRPGGVDAGAVGGFGLFGLYDARTFLADVSLDIHSGEDAYVMGMGVGGYYPFSRGNATPYVGLGLAYSLSRLGGAGGTGIRLQPTVGVLFGRLSTVQLRGELGYFVNTFGERTGQIFSATGPSPVGDKSYAHGPLFSIGAGF